MRPSQWKIQPPAADSLDAMTVIFPEPMESAVTLRAIRVAAATGDAINGEAALEEHERRWRFVPVTPWKRGVYKILIQSIIEDLAGNNIGKVFDVDKLDQVGKAASSSNVTSLAVEIR